MERGRWRPFGGARALERQNLLVRRRVAWPPFLFLARRLSFVSEKFCLFVCTCEPFFSHEQRGRRTSCSYGATSQVNSFPKTSTSLKGFVTSQKLPNLPIHAPGVVRVGIGRFSIQCTPGGDLRDTHQTDHVYESQEPNRLRASRLTDSRANAATAHVVPRHGSRFRRGHRPMLLAPV